MQETMMSIAHAIPLPWLFVGLGVIAAALLAFHRSRDERFGTPRRDVLFLLPCFIVGGAIGARAFQFLIDVIRFGATPNFWTADNLQRCCLGSVRCTAD